MPMKHYYNVPTVIYADGIAFTIEYKDLSQTEITLADDFNILKDIFRF